MESDKKCQDSAIFASECTKMPKIPKVDHKKIGQNPFLQELIIEATHKTEKDKWVIDEDGIAIPAHTLIEKQKSVRVYRLAGAKKRAMNLSSIACQMILYMIYSLEGTEDHIVITPEQYRTATENSSRNTYKKVIEELIRYGYITLTLQKYIYWINPALIFGGNRINKWPEKVVIKSTM